MSYDAAYYQGNKDRIATATAKYGKSAAGKAMRRSAQMRKFGLDAASFAALLEKQGGQCGLCNRTEPGGRGTWHIDHSHRTGIVRGLLCQACNMALGLFQDSPGRLQAAAEYVAAA